MGPFESMVVEETPCDHYAASERELELADEAQEESGDYLAPEVVYHLHRAHIHAILSNVASDEVLGARQ